MERVSSLLSGLSGAPARRPDDATAVVIDNADIARAFSIEEIEAGLDRKHALWKKSKDLALSLVFCVAVILGVAALYLGVPMLGMLVAKTLNSQNVVKTPEKTPEKCGPCCELDDDRRLLGLNAARFNPARVNDDLQYGNVTHALGSLYGANISYGNVTHALDSLVGADFVDDARHRNLGKKTVILPTGITLLVGSYTTEVREKLSRPTVVQNHVCMWTCVATEICKGDGPSRAMMKTKSPQRPFADGIKSMADFIASVPTSNTEFAYCFNGHYKSEQLAAAADTETSDVAQIFVEVVGNMYERNMFFDNSATQCYQDRAECAFGLAKACRAFHGDPNTKEDVAHVTSYIKGNGVSFSQFYNEQLFDRIEKSKEGGEVLAIAAKFDGYFVLAEFEKSLPANPKLAESAAGASKPGTYLGLDPKYPGKFDMTKRWSTETWTPNAELQHLPGMKATDSLGRYDVAALDQFKFWGDAVGRAVGGIWSHNRLGDFLGILRCELGDALHNVVGVKIQDAVKILRRRGTTIAGGAPAIYSVDPVAGFTGPRTTLLAGRPDIEEFRAWQVENCGLTCEAIVPGFPGFKVCTCVRTPPLDRAKAFFLKMIGPICSKKRKADAIEE